MAPGRRLPLRRHARGLGGLATRRSTASTPTPGPSIGRPFADARTGTARCDLIEDGAHRRRATGTGCRPAGSSRCGCATPAPPSTPTRGPGTRSASAARPTRGATRTSASTGASRGRSPSATPPTRCPGPSGPSERPRRPPRGRDDRRIAQDGAESPMNRVGRRNESAWLLPNDGTRTNHRLRQDMRRFDHDEEVDLVVVGCGAGGGVLTQRLARRGWQVVAFDAGPFWDPDDDWVSDEAGSHHLYWTEPRVISGDDPVPLGSNNSGPRRRRLDGPLRRLRAALPPLGLRDAARPTASAPTGRSTTRTCGRTTRRSKRSCRWPASTGRGAIPTATRSHRIRSAATARPSSRGCDGARHRGPRRSGRHRQRPLRQPAALHLPGLLPPGLQGERQGLAAHHPRPRRPGPRGRDPGRLHGQPDRDRRPTGGPPG